MERVVNPGPTDRTLLLSQYEHKSELLRKGEISFSCLMRTVCMNDAWNLFRLHRPHRRVAEILRRSGLYDVVCVGRMQYDCALVTTMVERWRPETHCFHLPFGEVTITLQDVQVLFGLRIDGDDVYMQDVARRIRPWRTLLETLTGCAIAPADMDGASQVRIHSITGYLRDRLQVDLIGDATPVERVEKISRLYMLVILGGILFSNASGNLISLQYLAFLDPIYDVGKYSWGNAVLAYLYRALCRASIGNAIDICGFIPLLQVWYWERTLPVQSSAPPPYDGDVLLPYARRWTRGINRDTESHHVLILIRDQLDRMTKDQFRWTPYSEILHTLPRCCTVDEPLWMACVPMLCLEIVKVHAPDRVRRQFGCPKHVPAIPSWGTNHHVHDQRRRLGSEVLEMLDKYFRDWGNRHQSLAVEVDDGTSGEGIAMSRGLFKLHRLALQWQRDTALASHGEAVSQIVRDTLLEAGIQFIEPVF
ncbi:serine/threonine-protein phosphatase 7 long form homolog [Solanum stenotomum]|uniref:serine/threonine-protein phosphatase 7 long form homolog n=1 Tax=Solanum stenotomum TaxID=172797 RepID=UPI0020D0B1C7|nr:serine/threonine-protein phosphatase 7 long form homolog [Solanum stenotomum]